jgi:retron-type reverse transcriptase
MARATAGVAVARGVARTVKLILEPIREAELETNAYRFRPSRSARGAIREVDELLHEGYTDIVGADSELR